MKDLIITNNDLIMSSYDFLNEVINPARISAGENPVRNNVFLDRIEDELDDLGRYKNFVTSRNTVKYYDLNIEQMTLVGMRESKAVRRKVLEALKELSAQRQPKIPTTFAEALQLAADQAKEIEVLAYERDEAIKTKAQIGSKREASAMARASAEARKAKALEVKLDQSREYASIKKMKIDYGGRYDWRLLKNASVEAGLSIKKAQDVNYGEVNSYHKSVWKSVYNLEIK